MKKLILLLFPLSLLIVSLKSNAQIICGTSHGKSIVYTNLDTAIYYADSGSTLYLSGGTFYLTGPYIGAINNGTNADSLNKPLNFVGAGYWPDSSTVTGTTTMTGDFLFINSLSSNSTFTGLNLTNIGTASYGNVNNVIFTRCIFNNGIQCGGGGNLTNNFTFSECIFNGAPSSANEGLIPNASAIFDRCLFFDGPSGWELSTTFTHCTFVGNPSNNNVNIGGNQNCSFLNCVFLNFYLGSGGQENNTYENCITNDSALYDPVDYHYNNISVNTIFNVATTNFFVNGTYPFSFDSNYQLLATSPGHNYATDGTDCGIYGTANPFKTGAVPYNPHFSLNNIAPATNTSGQLNINITTEAQSR